MPLSFVYKTLELNVFFIVLDGSRYPPTCRPKFLMPQLTQRPQVPRSLLSSEGCLMVEWEELRTVDMCHLTCPHTFQAEA